MIFSIECVSATDMTTTGSVGMVGQMCVLWSDITEPEHPEDKTSPVQCCTVMCTTVH